MAVSDGPVEVGPFETALEQCTHELMCILADAGAFTQRRSIVKQHAHLFKSFRLSILL